MGGLLTQTFFSFAYTLRTTSDYTKHLLDVDDFTHVIPGLLNNDKIEKWFRAIRGMVGSNNHLNVRAFLCV